MKFMIITFLYALQLVSAGKSKTERKGTNENVVGELPKQHDGEDGFQDKIVNIQGGVLESGIGEVGRGIPSGNYGEGAFQETFGSESGVDGLGGGNFASGFESSGANLVGTVLGTKITITRLVGVPVPQPYPVAVQRTIPYPVRVRVQIPVDRPYPVHIPRPYPVHVERPVPYHVQKNIPIPIQVPVKVPYPVRVFVPYVKPYPVHIAKEVHVPIPEPVIVKQAVPVLVHAGGERHGSGQGY